MRLYDRLKKTYWGDISLSLKQKLGVKKYFNSFHSASDCQMLVNHLTSLGYEVVTEANTNLKMYADKYFCTVKLDGKTVTRKGADFPEYATTFAAYFILEDLVKYEAKFVD